MHRKVSEKGSRLKKTISKKERNLKWKEAKSIIRTGHKGSHKNILIAFQKSEQWRFRINLTKKVKPAVIRNHYKRIIREVYRTSKPIIKQPYKIVFTVLNNKEDLDFHEFKKKYLELFSNANN